MAAEYSANALQIVPVGGSVVFTESPVPCNRGLISHRDESSVFRLANKFFRQNFCNCCKRSTNYDVAFHANIGVPEGGTLPTSPEGISIAVAIDGEVDPSSTMISTPTVVETLDNVGTDVIVQVPCLCSCSSVSIRNTSSVPIAVQNANIKFNN